MLKLLINMYAQNLRAIKLKTKFIEATISSYKKKVHAKFDLGALWGFRFVFHGNNICFFFIYIYFYACFTIFNLIKIAVKK